MDILNTKIKNILTEKTLKIRPENIKKDVTAFGITGTYEGQQPNLQSKSVTITENGTTTITPDTGYDGLDEVEITTNVSGGTSEYNVKMEYGATSYPLAQSIREINGLTAQSKSFSGFFTNCSFLTKIENLNLTGVTSLASAFSGCSALVSLDLEGIALTYLCPLNGTFYGCANLGNIDVHHWTGWNGTEIASMFYGCTSTEEIDISGLGTLYRVTSIASWFNGCTNLRTIHFPPTVRLSGVTNSSNTLNSAFARCPNLDNDTLNTILGFLPTMTKVTTASYKTLKILGFSSDQATLMQTLSNWSAAEAAGWTTGY